MEKLPISNENGSILAIAMFCLLILSIFGTFALNTSDYELNIAGNQQRWEKNFNTSEGGTTLEGSHVGYAGVNGLYIWFTIVDPEDHNLVLFPTTAIDYDPSPSQNDMPDPAFLPLLDPDPNTGKATWPQPDVPDNWPRQNLVGDINDNDYDYAYLVTYLYPDAAPKGTDATKFSSYKFRINGQRQVIIEMGGIKVGVKNPL